MKPDSIVVTTYKSPYGEGLLFWSGAVLTAHRLPGATGGPLGSIRQASTSLQVQTGQRVTSAPAALDLGTRLEAYFQGEPVEFPLKKLPIDWTRYSPFGLSVIQSLAVVAYGELMSYAALATAAGHPGAQRAVGSLMARNPLPIIIPCHRVVRSDGAPGRFSSGDAWKPRLLHLEAQAAALPQSRRIT